MCIEKKKNLPDAEIRPLQQLLDEGVFSPWQMGHKCPMKVAWKHHTTNQHSFSTSLMLYTLEETHKPNLKDYSDKMVHAHNCIVHQSTGFSQFFRLFGRDPTTDLVLPRKESSQQSSDGYAET